MTHPSAEFAHRVATEATPWDANVPDDAVVSPAPELDGVTPQTTQPVDGVDVDSMPALNDLSRALPSERARIQAAMMKVAKTLPKEWVEAGSEGVDRAVANGGLEDLDPDTFVSIFDQMEVLVFQVAKDAEAMREWMVSQESVNDALVYAFNRVCQIVGN